MYFPVLQKSAIICIIGNPTKRGSRKMKNSENTFRYQIKKGAYHRPGIERQGDAICFTAAVPEEKECSLLLYKKGEQEEAVAIPMERSTRYGDLRSVEIEKLPMGVYEYNYRIDGELVTDPYARRIAGRETWGQAPAGKKPCGAVLFPMNLTGKGMRPCSFLIQKLWLMPPMCAVLPAILLRASGLRVPLQASGKKFPI